MKKNLIVFLAGCLSVAFMASGVCVHAGAAKTAVTMGGDTIGHSRLLESKDENGRWTWSDGAAYPNAETDYVIRHFTRTPGDGRAFTFGGRSLTLDAGGSLNLKCTGDEVAYVFPRGGFVFAGGVLAHLAHGTRVAFGGTFTVTAPEARPAVYRPASDVRTQTTPRTRLAIDGPLISAPGTMLRVTADRSRGDPAFANWGILEVNGDVSRFRGTLDVRNYGVVFLNSAERLPGTLVLGENGYLGFTNFVSHTVDVEPAAGGGFWLAFDPKSGRTACVDAPGLRRAGRLGLVLAGTSTVKADCVGRTFGPLLKVPATSALTADDVALTVVGYDFTELPRFRIVAREAAGVRFFFAEACELTDEERARLPLHVWMDEEPDQTWTVEGQFPEVPGSVRAMIFEGDEANGSYNHHAHIFFHDGRFHATWSNQRYDEDGPGQRVLYASSVDAVTWSRPREFVPALSPEAPWGKAPGVFCQAGDFVVWKGRLFAKGICTEIVSWQSMDKSKSSPVHTRECYFPVYASRGCVVREIKADGSFGRLFSLLHDVRPEILMNPIPKQADVEPDFRFPSPAFKWNAADAFRQLPDHRLCEQVAWKTPTGEIVGLFRDDSRSGYKWMSFSKDGTTWTKPRITDMHDATSLTTPLTLADGTILLFGNHRCPGRNMPGYGWRDRDPLMVSVSRDGIHFSNTHTVREGYYQFRVSPGPRCRGGSAQYPCAILKDDRIHVIYSLGKESIETTSFPLANLMSPLVPSSKDRTVKSIAESEREFISPPVTGQVHASTVLPLKDGGYLAAWFEGTKERNPDVVIKGATRRNGRWLEKRVLAKVNPTAPHWNPVLRRADDGRISLYFKVGRNAADWRTYLIESRDEGENWTPPRELVVGDVEGGRGPVRTKCLRLKSGRWLAPASREIDLWRTFVDRSDDDGRTWTASEPIQMPDPEGQDGVIQPSLWLAPDDRVRAFMRSNTGYIWETESADDGVTWSPARRTMLPNNNSGIDLVKASDGCLYLVLNTASGDWASRSELEIWRSPDEGTHWTPWRVLEKEKTGEFSYPYVIEPIPGTLALTYTWKRQCIVFVELKIQ